MIHARPLSNVQEELLKLYSSNLTEQELKELKIVLAKYFADKAVKEADRVWEEKDLNNSKLDDWLNAK